MAIVIFVATGSYKNFSLSVKSEAWIYYLITAVFYGLYERMRFYITKALDASINSIISNITVVMAFFASVLLYNEALTLSKFMGFIMLMTSFFLVIDRKKSKINVKGVILGLVAGTFLGIGWALDKKGVLFFNAETYNLLIWLGPIIILFFPYIKLSEINREIKKYSWKIILLSFFNVTAYLLMLKAFSLSDATKVIPVTQLSILITVIAGVFLLKERSNLLKKILAGVIAVVGVFLLR